RTGALRVSIEWSGAPKLWSSCISGTGNLRGNSNQAFTSTGCDDFIIRRVAGTGAILQGSQVTFESVAQHRFLNALPSGLPTAFRIRNEATVPDTWERFTLHFAQGRRF
ncbi:MAG TPA: hypothetical protein VFZ61_27795, partial [Polyangiales bacterium]